MPRPTLVIRDATTSDAAAIAAVYDHYVLTSPVTFEVEAVGAEAMVARVSAVIGAGLPWLMAEVQGAVVGYAYASPFRPRAGYRYTVETTVYLTPAATRQGTGRALLAALLERLAALPVHRAVATIALPNDASVGLHQALGYVAAGHLPEVGRKFDQWIDIGYWVRPIAGTFKP